MGKLGRRPIREARKAYHVRVKAARQTLACEQGASLALPKRLSVSNTLCPYRTPAEEQTAREAVGLLRLLKKLAKILEPQQQKKLKLTVILPYGLLLGVFQTPEKKLSPMPIPSIAYWHG